MGTLGIFGGTFDPFHRAHLGLIEAALTSGFIDRLRVIPAGQPPHRPPPVASATHRLAMVRAGIKDLPDALQTRTEIDPAEVDTQAPSYTAQTLERLRAELGAEQPLALILGADAFLGLPTWHRWREITKLTHLLITARPGQQLTPEAMPAELRAWWLAGAGSTAADLGGAPAGHIASFTMPESPLSATAIRQQLQSRPNPSSANPLALNPLLPAGVVRYIRGHHLYELS